MTSLVGEPDGLQHGEFRGAVADRLHHQCARREQQHEECGPDDTMNDRVDIAKQRRLTALGRLSLRFA